jgi:hypothetical protein
MRLAASAVEMLWYPLLWLNIIIPIASKARRAAIVKTRRIFILEKE